MDEELYLQVERIRNLNENAQTPQELGAQGASLRGQPGLLHERGDGRSAKVDGRGGRSGERRSQKLLGNVLAASPETPQLDAEMLTATLGISDELFKKGHTSFPAWSQEILDLTGDYMRPELPRLYNTAKTFFDGQSKKPGRNPVHVRYRVSNRRPMILRPDPIYYAGQRVKQPWFGLLRCSEVYTQPRCKAKARSGCPSAGASSPRDCLPPTGVERLSPRAGGFHRAKGLTLFPLPCLSVS